MIVSASHTVLVARPPDVVWDFTQDYTRRCEWDRGLTEARVLSKSPMPRVAIRAPGGLGAVFEYKLFDRPRRTSLEMTEVRSWLFAGGGGSWSYTARPGGTEWTQTNSLRFRNRFFFVCLGAVTRRALQRATERAMEAARQRLEEAT